MTDFEPIEDLVPHRKPMRLIDRVLDAGPGAMRCAGVVTDDNPFLCDGLLESVSLVEYMAQAMAAFVTWRGPRDSTMGYLVGARNVDLPESGIHAGDELEVRVQEDGVLGDYASFNGEVFHRGRTVCKGNLKVFRVRGEVP